MKNLMGKGRMKMNDRPYIELVGVGNGWRYHVLKTYQADGQKPYARAMCEVWGFAQEVGDVYIDDLRRLDLVGFDETVFESADAAAEALFGKGARA
jgi:hypothetical protein